MLSLPPAGSMEQQTLEIATKKGVHVFSVELAVTDEERQKGLMFRKSLPESYGMLFDFQARPGTCRCGCTTPMCRST